MKTVVIGLDGATFDVINPLSKEGRLPVLTRLKREGTSAQLLSTILPNSFPGWASCTTGTSEGMHGVFSPFIKQPGSYGVRAMSGHDIMTRPIWDILSEQGGRSLARRSINSGPCTGFSFQCAPGQRGRGQRRSVPAGDFAQPVAGRRRTRLDRLIAEGNRKWLCPQAVSSCPRP